MSKWEMPESGTFQCWNTMRGEELLGRNGCGRLSVGIREREEKRKTKRSRALAARAIWGSVLRPTLGVAKKEARSRSGPL
jgi:hypothetical protein